MSRLRTLASGCVYVLVHSNQRAAAAVDVCRTRAFACPLTVDVGRYTVGSCQGVASAHSRVLPRSVHAKKELGVSTCLHGEVPLRFIGCFCLAADCELLAEDKTLMNYGFIEDVCETAHDDSFALFPFVLSEDNPAVHVVRGAPRVCAAAEVLSVLLHILV